MAKTTINGTSITQKSPVNKFNSIAEAREAVKIATNLTGESANNALIVGEKGSFEPMLVGGEIEIFHKVSNTVYENTNGEVSNLSSTSVFVMGTFKSSTGKETKTKFYCTRENESQFFTMVENQSSNAAAVSYWGSINKPMTKSGTKELVGKMVFLNHVKPIPTYKGEDSEGKDVWDIVTEKEAKNLVKEIQNALGQIEDVEEVETQDVEG